MASLEAFDNEVKDLVTSGKLSSSKVKSVTDAAMANIASDAHIVATLFKAHKQAKSTHKISSLYVIDAIAREARQQVKKASKGKQSTSNGSTPLQDGSIDDDDDVVLGRKSKGTYASFLSKIESFLDRLVSEVLTKGPPEHKDKVKKVLDIWKKSSTFSSDALNTCYARLAGEVPDTDISTKKSSNRQSSSKTAQRSTTPPYPPPTVPLRFPPLPPTFHNSTSQTTLPTQAGTQFGNQHSFSTIGQPNNDIAALLNSISAATVPPVSQPAINTHPSIGGFEWSQLALLQQLASQSTASAQPAALPLPAFPPVFPPPANHSSVSQQVNAIPYQQPAASSSTSCNDTYRQPNNSNNWNHSTNGASSRARPSSPDRRPGGRISRWVDASDEPPQRRNRDQRSNSPSQSQFSQDRRKSPPKDRDDSPPTQRRNNWGSRADRDYSSSARAARPAQVQTQDTQRIATFISEDRDDPRPMKSQAGKGRQDYDSSDFSSFEVKPTAMSQTSQAQVSQNDMSNQGANLQQQSQSLEMNAQAASYMTNPAVFDPSSFNPMDPASWASFAMFCQQSMGYLPSNMEMCQWIMGSMTMMQNATAQMNGGSSVFGMQGMQDMQGMQEMQGRHNVQNMQGVVDETNEGQNAEDQFNSRFNSQQDWDTYASHQDTVQHKTTDGTLDLNQSEAKDASSAGNDEGEGEADMSMTPEPEES